MNEMGREGCRVYKLFVFFWVGPKRNPEDENPCPFEKLGVFFVISQGYCLCRGLLNLSPALDTLLPEAGHVELDKVLAVLVVVDTLSAVALLELLLDNTALHGADPRLADSESAGAEDS